MGTASEGFGTQDLEANTDLRHSAVSCAELAVVPFEVREGIEGEHTPKINFKRYHQFLEEGDKFESSFLRLDMFSGSLASGDTLVVVFVE